MRICFYTFLSVFVLLFAVGADCSHAGDPEPVLKMRVGAYDNRPKIYFGENGDVIGLYRDLLDEFARQQRWEIEYVPGKWEECLERLEAGEITMMPDVAYSAERAERFKFNKENILVNWGRIYVARGSKIDCLPELEGKTIAVMKSSIHTEGSDGVKSLMEQFNIPCSFREVDDYTEVFELLHRRKVDAGVVNRIFGSKHEGLYRVQRTSVIFNPVELKFAFKKDFEDTQKIIPAIDSMLAELKKDYDSIYYKSIENHLGFSIIHESEKFPEWAKAVMYAAGLLIVFFIVSVILCRIQIRRKTRELREAQVEVLWRFGKAIEYKDYETGHHTAVVSEISYRIALELGLPHHEARIIREASKMHDIGKLVISDNILLKPGKLNPEEWDEMKKHTTLGAILLSDGKSDIITTAEIIAKSHHEKWDGTGYPLGLKGEEIPLAGRICAIADVAHAMNSHRPYKEAFPIEDIVKIITATSGTHFDPKVVSAFLKILPDIIRKLDLK